MLGRILVFSHTDVFQFEIIPDGVMSAYMTEEINGEHCLDIATTQQLQKAQRLLLQDGLGKWHEYVVTGIDELHNSGKNALGTYHAVWSVQYDLSTVYDVERLGEIEQPVRAKVCLDAALEGTKRWNTGTVDLDTYAMPVMFGNSCWERVCDVVNLCEGELETAITVGANKVISRKVNLLAQLGSRKVTRRFDWGHDITSIRRKPSEDPLCCRIIPQGKSDDVIIDDLNNGVEYLQDNDAASAYRVPDGSGGWEYPTRIVKFSDIDDDRDLLAYAKKHLTEYTRPVPTYEASVLQYAQAGMDVQGVALGDVVHIVDSGFNPDVPLRLEGRITKIVTNLVNASDTQLVVGDMGNTLSRTFRSLAASIGAISSKLDAMYDNSGQSTTTDEYLSWLIQAINAKINQTGGYTYIKEGEGIWVYDRAEDQSPTRVINLTGGSLRIASSKTADGDWNWQTIMTAEDGLLASAVTAANLTAGFIGSPSGNYWNLDTGELRMASNVLYTDGKGNEYPFNDYVELASTVAAKAQVAAVSVGATQLLNGTGTLTGVDKTSNWANGTWRGASGGTGTRSVVDADAPPNNNIKRMLKIVGNGTNTDVAQDSVPVVQGETYLLACYTKGKGTLRIQVGTSPYLAVTASINSNTWKRYYMRFTAGEGKAGMKDGKTNVFFGNVGSGTLYLCGMKMERGNKCTDWSQSPDDEKMDATAKANEAVKVAEATAGKKATDALNKAKTYTNAISKSDREFSVSQREALNNSLNQAGILKRLTNNYKARGIYIEEGQLFIRGDYIRTGTLDAGIVKAGILTDTKRQNIWNMATGYLETKNAVMKNANVTGQFSCGSRNIMELKNGQLIGYQDSGKTYCGYIDYSATVKLLDTGKYVKGLQMTAPGIIRISSPRIGVLNSSDVSKTTTTCFTGTKKYNTISNIRGLSDGRIEWVRQEHGIRCINGLVTSVW